MSSHEDLELDVDLRLMPVIVQISALGLEPTTLSRNDFFACLRYAYALGHLDAVQDPDPHRWYADHGYQPPRVAR